MKADDTYKIGEFNITDAQAALKFTGSLSRKEEHVDGSILLFFSRFHTQDTISFKFSTVKARGFIASLKTCIKNKEKSFKIHSGGKNTSKHIEVTNLDADIKFVSHHNGSLVFISLSIEEAFGLCEEIAYLIQTTMDACYKLQRVAWGKKRKLQKSANE